MGNRFGRDILIQAQDPQAAANFYTTQLGFTVTDPNPAMIALEGPNINLFIARGPILGAVLEVTVGDVAAARKRLTENGCSVVKDEPEFPRCYVRDPFGLIYNLRR